MDAIKWEFGPDIPTYDFISEGEGAVVTPSTC